MTTLILAATGAAVVVGAAVDRMAFALLRPHRRPIGRTPDDIGLAGEEFDIDGDPGLVAWWMKGEAPEGPVVILAHGWGANAGSVLPLAPAIVPHASAVVAADIRGHGRSDDASMASIRHFRDDLARVVAEVQRRAPGREIALVGHSMGGAAGILAAELTGALSKLVLVAAPHDVFGTVARYLQERGLPGSLLVPLFIPSWRVRIGESSDRLNPGRALAAIGVSTLVIQPSDDTRVPPREGEALARAAGSVVATVEGAGHSDVLQHPDTAELISQFLEHRPAA